MLTQENKQALLALRQYPNSGILRVAEIIGRSSMAVSVAQHEWLKQVLKDYRKSPIWDTLK